MSVGDGWGPFLVISQRDLHDLVANEDLGSETDSEYVFYVRYHRGDDGIETILCSDSDLTEYKDDFSRWERIEH